MLFPLKNIFPTRGILFPLFIFFTLQVYGQTKSNLDLFFQLADSAAVDLQSNLKEAKNIQIDFVPGKEYRVFQNSILSHFPSNGLKDETAKTIVQFAVTEAGVTYGEPERNGLFGSFKIERKLRFSGNYSIIANSTGVRNFSFSTSEEIPYEDLSSVENSSFPFTEGKIPAEPFFSSLFEPAIALGSAAAAVYIFFTARSK